MENNEMIEKENMVEAAVTAEAPVSAEAPETEEKAIEPEIIPSMDDFKEEINHSLHKYVEGDIVNGTVIGISETEVTVDLGAYAEGIIKAEELSNDPRFSIKGDIAVGDKVSAIVLREDREGNVILSVKQADDKLAWDKLAEMLKEKTVSKVKVAEAVKGGCVTYLCGIRAFIPASQLSVEYVEDVSTYAGKELDVAVINVDAESKKLVLSAKEVAKANAQEEHLRRLNNLIPGTVTTGTVEKIMQFGAFVNIGNGLSGLVHVSQICDKRIKSPAEVLKEGDTVTVKIIGVKDGKLSLSIKEATEKEVVEEVVEEAPMEYISGGEVKTSLASLLKGIKLD